MQLASNICVMNSSMYAKCRFKHEEWTSEARKLMCGDMFAGGLSHPCYFPRCGCTSPNGTRTRTRHLLANVHFKRRAKPPAEKGFSGLCEFLLNCVYCFV